MLFTMINDFLHLLATVVWIGGLIYINLVLMPSLTAIDPPQRGKLSGAVAKRFTILAWCAVIILLITGYLKTPSGMLFNISNTSAVALTIKHILVLVMIAIGLLVTFVTAPKMKSLAPEPGEPPPPEFLKAQKQLSTLALTNMILGILVLLSVAIP